MVRTFSRTYPFYHPKAGEPTFFVEKVLKSLLDKNETSVANYIYDMGQKLGYQTVDSFYQSIEEQTPKHHTIRAGQHFKPGDTFSPRVWSGTPYASKQIQFAPEITIVKTWKFEISKQGNYAIDEMLYNATELKEVATNDGFTNLDDFELWFNLKRNEVFSGQIICWNPKLEY